MRSTATSSFRGLYPPIETFHEEYLNVSDGHKLYVEQSGNPNGIPVIFLHGGPGGGTSPTQRRFFDPQKFHIILFDQRGCGKSEPHASLENNTTWDLIKDIEAIREHLNIEKWAVFGGSWGSTLALLYAIVHPERTNALILRGIFLMRERELDWFYGGGTGALFPEEWSRFKNTIPHHEHNDLIAAYHTRLTSDQIPQKEQLMYAKEWSLWEASTVTLNPDQHSRTLSVDPRFALAFARIEAHYFKNKGFLDNSNYILDNCHKLQGIPITLVQGRYDAICPPVSAYELAKEMPWTTLKIVPVAGHSAFEPAITHELICATDDL
ncbi:prolyl aminopeptidase [Kordiimonas sp. SCSIO 12610]|uniref:prolyl aminopeptidase n=1 Tax=Kordiimonas sp. SCSIO 12610 TaxID=2829597 RepID=UPI00210A91B1|nr:prolyl aminopeptidase [Kordiimonas sp. SCSIO 12610]UTW55168.1 prolyl aminopeptidase [Kordiimonas sp. SCSIO 12610]